MKKSTQENKIGLFFGSFNPIHVGHLIIANHMVEFSDLKKIWFVISPHNPLKEKHTLLADHHRLAMVNVAVEDNSKFKASSVEFKLPQPSYTIHTLTYLQEKYPAKKFVLIVGADNLPTFHKWKNYEQILEQYELYVYPRPNTHNHPLMKHPKVKMIDAPLIEISSSFIRTAIKNKQDVKYLLTEKVYEYVKEMHFFEK
jgi:nicotinate-nucleotide adenylyltransferase